MLQSKFVRHDHGPRTPVPTYWTKRTDGVEFSPRRSTSGKESYQPSSCVYWLRISRVESSSISVCVTYWVPWIMDESKQRLLYTARTLLGCRRSNPSGTSCPAYGIHSLNSSLSNAVGNPISTPPSESCGRQPVVRDHALRK